MKVTSRTTLKQIREVLQSDNYHMLYRGMHYDYKPMASEITQAAKRKTLIWEDKKITITDREIICFSCTEDEWADYLNKFREKQIEKQIEEGKEATKSHFINMIEQSKAQNPRGMRRRGQPC